ncbi:hypothetical protein L3X38_045029 [Prunus dulcis]|uniref:Uncharacterized protein n=1 Tax=Prunus dulcis TaxID=3755 RepID=A0AAD4V0Y1_PRUDU|nr:hypothetical protein L3X38_045029 [Prunus dulcis]
MLEVRNADDEDKGITEPERVPCIVVYSAAWCLIRAPLFDGRFVCAVEAIENFSNRIEKSWLILRHGLLMFSG